MMLPLLYHISESRILTAQCVRKNLGQLEHLFITYFFKWFYRKYSLELKQSLVTFIVIMFQLGNKMFSAIISLSRTLLHR